MVRKCILACLCALFCQATFGQETLNIHTKSKGVVSIPFAEHPEISFTSENMLKVVSAKLNVEYAFDEIETISFEDNTSDIKDIIHKGHVTGMTVYNMAGVMVRRIEAENGSCSLDWLTLPPGIYIIKEGQRTYKITIK
jgi:hypothetical protein